MEGPGREESGARRCFDVPLSGEYGICKKVNVRIWYI